MKLGALLVTELCRLTAAVLTRFFDADQSRSACFMIGWMVFYLRFWRCGHADTEDNSTDGEAHGEDQGDGEKPADRQQPGTVLLHLFQWYPRSISVLDVHNSSWGAGGAQHLCDGEVDGALCCPVSTEVYAEQGPYQPRMLPCGHTFSLEVVTKMHKKRAAGELVCPLCKKRTKQPLSEYPPKCVSLCSWNALCLFWVQHEALRLAMKCCIYWHSTTTTTVCMVLASVDCNKSFKPIIPA